MLLLLPGKDLLWAFERGGKGLQGEGGGGMGGGDERGEG